MSEMTRVKMNFKNPNAPSLHFQRDVPILWTVADLKKYLLEQYPHRPSSVDYIKLVFKGQILQNHMHLWQTLELLDIKEAVVPFNLVITEPPKAAMSSPTASAGGAAPTVNDAGQLVALLAAMLSQAGSPTQQAWRYDNLTGQWVQADRVDSAAFSARFPQTSARVGVPVDAGFVAGAGIPPASAHAQTPPLPHAAPPAPPLGAAAAAGGARAVAVPRPIAMPLPRPAGGAGGAHAAVFGNVNYMLLLKLALLVFFFAQDNYAMRHPGTLSPRVCFGLLLAIVVYLHETGRLGFMRRFAPRVYARPAAAAAADGPQAQRQDQAQGAGPEQPQGQAAQPRRAGALYMVANALGEVRDMLVAFVSSLFPTWQPEQQPPAL